MSNKHPNKLDIFRFWGCWFDKNSTYVTIFWLHIDQKIINQEKNLRADPENNPEL